MKIILNENTSLSFNMAAEEYLMKHFDDDIFMLWRAKKSILIGKNQNALAEINHDYVKEHNIDVVRRLSGGGTVFCDLGNTNFAFIVSDKESFSNFRKFTQPILDVLHKLNVDAQFTGRNDLTINNMKFSGNAQYKYKNRLLHHGTLLFRSDLKDLVKAIRPPKIKYASKGISSVKSRVTNIADHLDSDLDITTFRQMINEHVYDTTEDTTYYEFSSEDIAAIQAIEKERFLTWEWNYGKSPQYQVSRAIKFPGGVVQVFYETKKENFTHIKFYGDFFSRHDIQTIEEALLHTTHREDSMRSILSNFELDDYFKNISIEELLSLFF